MHASRANKLRILWLAIGVVLAACSSGNPGIGALSTPDLSPTPEVPSPTPTSIPRATQTPVPVPIELTILHTNDNWGATEPCG